MDNATLFRAKELDQKIKCRENLIEHFERLVNNDPLREVENLLTGYNNLMAGFNRVEIAEFMIASFSEYTKKELEEFRQKLEKL